MPTHPAIAFLLNSLEFGGAQRVFIDDANDFVRDGFAVSFFILYGKAGEYPLERDLDPRVEKIFLEAKGSTDSSALNHCLDAVTTKKIRVLFSTLNDGNSFARRVRRATSVRWISREANALSSKTIPQKIADALSFHLPYRIIALSTEAQKSLCRLLPFARKKIILLPNTVVLPQLEEKIPGASGPLILSVGRLDRQKNPYLFIHALAALARSGHKFTAVMVGDGPLREALQQEISALGLNEKVTLTGHLPHDQVLQLYRKAYVFVSTSRWEGSPNVLLEAMSYGVPVIATKVGGAPDIIKNKEEGILIPSDDQNALLTALTCLLGDDTLRAKIGAGGRTRVRSSFSGKERFERLRAIVTAF